MRWPMPKLDDGKCTPCGEKTSGPTPEGVKDGVAHARTHAVRPREQPVVEFRDSTKGAHNSLYLRTGREPCVGLVRLSVVGTFMFPLPFDNVFLSASFTLSSHVYLWPQRSGAPLEQELYTVYSRKPRARASVSMECRPASPRRLTSVHVSPERSSIGQLSRASVGRGIWKLG